MFFCYGYKGSRFVFWFKNFVFARIPKVNIASVGLLMLILRFGICGLLKGNIGSALKNTVAECRGLSYITVAT